jgi:hypothetical protein
MRLDRLLLWLCLWLALSVLVYLGIARWYGDVVLLLSEWLLRPWLTVPVTLTQVPGMGITLSYPGIRQPLGFRFDLQSITLNLIFVPPLVLTTVAAVAGWRSTLLRLLQALLVVLFLHAAHMTVLMMHFLTQSPNPLVAPGFPDTLAAFFHQAYRFADKMGYTLFPFIAWVGTCYRPILQLFEGLRQRGESA